MNHTLSDSQLEEMIKSAVNSSGPLPPDEKFSQLISALRELQERRKAARDSVPVAYTDERNLGYIDRGRETAYLWGKQNSESSDVALYRHAQQPVVPDYPETLPCPVLLEPGMRFGKGVKTRLVLDAIQRRAEHYAELEAMTTEERAEYDANIEAFKVLLPQPAPIVPDIDELRLAFEAAERESDDGFNLHKYGIGYADDETQGRWDTWLACRAAMLQAGTLTNENTRQVDELTMWIKRLVRSLKNANPDSKLPRDAMDYLTAKGLISLGDVLR